MSKIIWSKSLLFGIVAKGRMMLMNSNWDVSPELLEIRDCTFVVAENIPFSWYGGSCGTYIMDKTETLLGLDRHKTALLKIILEGSHIRV